jgi:hypothetical protein
LRHNSIQQLKGVGEGERDTYKLHVNKVMSILPGEEELGGNQGADE